MDIQAYTKETYRERKMQVRKEDFQWLNLHIDIIADLQISILYNVFTIGKRMETSKQLI